MAEPSPHVTAGVIVIGDEVLSGRTQDANVRSIARFLGPLGVQLREVRIVSDDRDAIVEAVNALRTRCDYVFTTGGIGPTHDDVTADSVAAAFGAPIGEHEGALAMLQELVDSTGDELTPARRRMARTPAGADLIRNPAVGAPGFQIENVFVLAGVPGIMRGMLEDIPHRIRGGAVVASRTVRAARLREGDIADPLAAAQAAAPDVALGSYPYFRGPGDYGVHLVARGSDIAALDAAAAALEEIVRAVGAAPERVEEEAG